MPVSQMLSIPFLLLSITPLYLQLSNPPLSVSYIHAVLENLSLHLMVLWFADSLFPRKTGIEHWTLNVAVKR